MRRGFAPGKISVREAGEKFLIQQKLVASGEKLIVLRELIEGEERFESIQIRTVP